MRRFVSPSAGIRQTPLPWRDPLAPVGRTGNRDAVGGFSFKAGMDHRSIARRLIAVLIAFVAFGPFGAPEPSADCRSTNAGVDNTATSSAARTGAFQSFIGPRR